MKLVMHQAGYGISNMFKEDRSDAIGPDVHNNQ